MSVVELLEESIPYNDLTKIIDKPRKFGGASKSYIVTLGQNNFLMKCAIPEEYFATRLLNHLNPQFFQNMMFLIVDKKGGIECTKGLVPTANKIIHSFVSLKFGDDLR